MANRLTPAEWLEISPARKRLLCYWTLLHFLPRRGQALVVDTERNLVEQLALERGYDCVRVPSATALDRHGTWIEPWIAADHALRLLPPRHVHPALLGSRSAIREYRPAIQPGLRHTPPTSVRLPIATLDELLAGLQDVGFIHINDDAQLSEIVRGGGEGLSGSQAVVTFVLPNAINESLHAALDELRLRNYQLFDTGFQPLGPSDHVGIRECVALPARLAESLPEQCQRAMLWGELEEDLDNRSDSRVSDRRLMPLVGSHSKDGDQRLLSAAGVNWEILREGLTSRRLPFGLDSLPADNWYAMEKDGGYHWRWSGPGRDARLLLPLPAPGHYTLSCKVMAAVVPELLGQANVFVDGRYFPDVGRQLLPGATVHVSLAVSREEWTGVMELLIALPKTVCPSPNDPRNLGLSLDWLSLQWRGLE